MKKLIELDAAVDAVHRSYDTILDFRSDGETVANSVEDILSALPSAQPVAKDINVSVKDCISRQAALDALEKIDCSDGVGISSLKCDAVDDAVTAIKALPSAQKKGHWIDEGTNYSCSECHRGCWVNSNYCPWCGADMRGDKHE